MRCDVVEGEPGIFPEPIARIMRGIGARQRRDEDHASTAETRPSSEPADADTPGPDDKP